MRFFPLLLWLLVASCTTVQPVPKGQHNNEAIEYCGGELWGYVLPLGPRENAGFWTRKFDDPKPMMALFMHMHSVLEADPEHSLTLHFALRTKENLKAEFPDNKFIVGREGHDEKAFALDMTVFEDALTVERLYPGDQYKTELVDKKTNQWSVAKRNRFFTFITGKPKLIQLPVSKTERILKNSVNVVFDGQNYAQTFVLASANIWPEKEPLKNSVITVRVPRFSLNGVGYGPQEFKFDMAYEKVKGSRSSYGRCPSTEEIFRFND